MKRLSPAWALLGSDTSQNERGKLGQCSLEGADKETSLGQGDSNPGARVLAEGGSNKEQKAGHTLF